MNVSKAFRIITLLVMFGLSVVAYGDAIVGETMVTISGRVGLPGGEEGSLIPFNGNMPVTSDPQGGVGVIANGQLSFFIGTPATLGPLESALEEVVRGWGNVTISIPAATGAMLVLRTPEPGMALRRVYSGGAAMSRWEGGIYYIFVDRDVTITANRRIENISQHDGWEYIVDYRAFNITLRTGWNAIRRSGSNSAGEDNPQDFMVFRLSLATADEIEPTWAGARWAYVHDDELRHWF